MWDFSIGRAMALMAKTSPYIAFRLIIYVGIAVAYVVVTGVGAGIGWGVGGLGDEGAQANLTMWGGIIGFGLTAGVLYFLREYLLYMVKAGHIAVLVELLDGKALPEGKSQVSHGAEVVKSRFAQANVLFALDQIIKGVLRAIIGLVQGITSFIPGSNNIMGIVKAFLRIAVGFIDEVILAYAIRTRAENPWASARTALVLYGQNAPNLMKNAAWLTVIVYGITFLLFLILLAPAGALVYLMPGSWSAAGILFALVFAWALKAALIEPFAITCLMQVYFKAIEGQVPNQEWEDRLESVSDKFKEMKGKAEEWVTTQGGSGQREAGPGSA